MKQLCCVWQVSTQGVATRFSTPTRQKHGWMQAIIRARWRFWIWPNGTVALMTSPDQFELMSYKRQDVEMKLPRCVWQVSRRGVATRFSTPTRQKHGWMQAIFRARWRFWIWPNGT